MHLDFEMVPYLKSVSGICRFFLIEAAPALRLYVTPIQIDPEDPEMPISTPGDYSVNWPRPSAPTTRRDCPRIRTRWRTAS